MVKWTAFFEQPPCQPSKNPHPMPKRTSPMRQRTGRMRQRTGRMRQGTGRMWQATGRMRQRTGRMRQRTGRMRQSPWTAPVLWRFWMKRSDVARLASVHTSTGPRPATAPPPATKRQGTAAVQGDRLRHEGLVLTRVCFRVRVVAEEHLAVHGAIRTIHLVHRPRTAIIRHVLTLVRTFALSRSAASPRSW